MASAAEVIGAAIYHALGYNVVQGYIVEVDPARIVIAPTATTVDLGGQKRPMTRQDVDKLLARAARLPGGKYRATLSRFAEGARRFLATGLDELAEVAQAGQLVADADRREELARLCLKSLGLRPAGESVAQAEDRLSTLDSVERSRVIREARAAEERARKIREEMARKAAEEAAAVYGRE